MNLPLPEWLQPWIDKLIHFGLFLVLALLVGRCFDDSRGAFGTPRMAFGVTMLYVVFLEIAQLWVPGRSWELLDVVSGLLGVLLGMGFHYRARIGQEV